MEVAAVVCWVMVVVAVVVTRGVSEPYLDDQRVAGKQSRGQGVEHVVEGVVPGHDGAHLHPAATTSNTNLSHGNSSSHANRG